MTAITLLIVVIGTSFTQKEVSSIEEEGPIAHPTIGLETVLNKERALEVGIEGYVHVKTTNGSPETLVIEKGKSDSVSFEIELVSYTPSYKEAELTISPQSGVGWTSGRCYGKGEPLILLNDYINYDKSGELTVYIDKPVTVTMTITVPEDAPSFELPLKAVGIGVDAPSVFDSEVVLIVK